MCSKSRHKHRQRLSPETFADDTAAQMAPGKTQRSFTQPKEKLDMPKSAYPTMYRDFDASLASIDDVEDISNMARDTSDLHIDTSALADSDLDDSSFDDILGTRRSEPSSPVSPMTPRKGSINTSTAPRGHLFHLKQTQAPVYLSYPATGDSDAAHIDNYGRVEYELATKERAMVVIIPNSRGLSVNNQKLADAYATRTGCVTALLDVYFDDPLPDTPPEETDKNSSFISRFKSLTIDLAASVKRSYWLQSHTVFGVFNEEEKRFQATTEWVTIHTAIDELLKQHSVQSAVVIGFSFGANAAARVAIEGVESEESQDEDKPSSSIIKGVVLVHPIYLPLEVFTVVKIPTHLIVGHQDAFCSQDDLNKFENDLKLKKNRYNYKFTQMKTKDNTPHGFAIAGDYPPMRLGDLPTKTCQKIIKWVLERV